MNKGMIILAIAGAVTVVGAGAGGAMYALNSGTSTNAVSEKASEKSEPQEEVKQTGWVEENGNKYFYKDNEKQTNWIQDDNSWYYLGSDGKMMTGWIQDNGNWFYLNKDGSLATNTTIGDYYVDENGFIADAPSSKKEAQNNSSQNNNTIQTIANRKPTSKEDAKNIVAEEDGEFIQRLNNEFPKEFVHPPADGHLVLDPGEIKNVKRYCNLSWDMPNEDCYTVYLDEYYNGSKSTFSGYKCIYFVGIETGNIYLVPPDGNKPVYQIKNNQIVRRFPWLSINGSSEWH